MSNTEPNIVTLPSGLRVNAPSTELATPVKMVYRYHCPACTGIAFTSSNMMPFTKIECQNCGKLLVECDMNNYFSLEELDGES